MLPTPHGPTDVPLPGGAGDADVDKGRTPDEGALLRVVEHLADVPDGDAGDDTSDTAPQDDAPQDDAPSPDDAPAQDAPAEGASAVPAADARDDGAADDEDADADDADADDEDATHAPSDETPAAPEPTDEVAPQLDEESSADAPPVEDAGPVDDAGPDDDDEPTTEAGPTDDATPAASPEPAPPADAQPPAPLPPAPAELPEHVVGPVAAALSDTRHRIDELNAAERVFLAQQRALVAELCEDPSDAEAVSALFDRVREQWTQAEDKPDLQPLADAFGIALGDLVCADAEDLGWATCSDRYGTEIVLAREDPEVLVYPVAAVLQNWPYAGPGWFLRHLRTVVRGVVGEPDADA